jgi:6-phosphogluconolactonase
VIADGADFVRRASAWLADGIRRAAARGVCRVALAGGETPRPIYAALAASARAIAWDHVEIFFSDERAVPPDDPQSNYRMVRETLLASVGLPEAQVHRMEAEQADLTAAARAYDAQLPPRLDVLLLGMGADGHTASLFPGDAALNERARRVVPVVSGAAPSHRLTITPPVIALARRVAVLATGSEKAEVAARALEGPFSPLEVPVQLALAGTWFLDHAAATRLTAPPR